MPLPEIIGLWILAALLLAIGVWSLIRRRRTWGLALVVAALLVGPGGEIIFH